MKFRCSSPRGGERNTFRCCAVSVRCCNFSFLLKECLSCLLRHIIGRILIQAYDKDETAHFEYPNFVFVLMVFFAVSSPPIVWGSTADRIAMGICESAWCGSTRGWPTIYFPPTPTGVFDDHYTVPLDGSQYFRATNGFQTLVIVRKNGFLG